MVPVVALLDSEVHLGEVHHHEQCGEEAVDVAVVRDCRAAICSWTD